MSNFNQNAETVTKEVGNSLLKGVKGVSRFLLATIYLTGALVVVTSLFGIANVYTFTIFMIGFLASIIAVIQILINFLKEVNKNNNKDPKQNMGFKAKSNNLEKVSIRK